MSSATVTRVHDVGIVAGLRIKLRLSETERERLHAQLDAEGNMHAARRRWDFAMGLLGGIVVTLTTLAMVGAL